MVPVVVLVGDHFPHLVQVKTQQDEGEKRRKRKQQVHESSNRPLPGQGRQTPTVERRCQDGERNTLGGSRQEPHGCWAQPKQKAARGARVSAGRKPFVEHGGEAGPLQPYHSPRIGQAQALHESVVPRSAP